MELSKSISSYITDNPALVGNAGVGSSSSSSSSP